MSSRRKVGVPHRYRESSEKADKLPSAPWLPDEEEFLRKSLQANPKLRKAKYQLPSVLLARLRTHELRSIRAKIRFEWPRVAASLGRDADFDSSDDEGAEAEEDEEEDVVQNRPNRINRLFVKKKGKMPLPKPADPRQLALERSESVASSAASSRPRSKRRAPLADEEEDVDDVEADVDRDRGPPSRAPVLNPSVRRVPAQFDLYETVLETPQFNDVSNKRVLLLVPRVVGFKIEPDIIEDGTAVRLTFSRQPLPVAEMGKLKDLFFGTAAIEFGNPRSFVVTLDEGVRVTRDGVKWLDLEVAAPPIAVLALPLVKDEAQPKPIPATLC